MFAGPGSRAALAGLTCETRWELAAPEDPRYWAAVLLRRRYPSALQPGAIPCLDSPSPRTRCL